MIDPHLAPNLARVAALEKQLEEARASVRDLAAALGIPTKRMFAKSRFVTRETAYGWIDEARADAVWDQDATANAYRRGEEAGFDRCLEMGAMLRRLAEDPTPSKYAHLVRLANTRRSYDALDADQPDATDPKAIAKQVIAAGAKARGASGPLPPTGTLARQILDAGAKRRGENPDDQATDDQDDEGQPNGDDDDNEQPVRKRKKRGKQHPETDEIPEVLEPPERSEPDPALMTLKQMRNRTPEELEQLHKPEPKVIDLADAIIAAGRKARGLPPLKG
jgi:hypothetical protein